MDYGVNERDRALQSAFYELSQACETDEQREKMGHIFTKYFVLKQDVRDAVGKVIVLLKMWQCEGEKHSVEEQIRLNNLMNEQIGELLR